MKDPAVSPGPVDAAALTRWSEALSAIARTGLGFTESNFEAERYEEILAIAADVRVAADGLQADADAGTGSGFLDPGDAKAAWLHAVGSGVPGYVTPKVAIGAVVGDDQGRLLLIQRADSGVWLYPTGWADVGYSPAEVAVKEVREETGIVCEGLDAGWFTRDDLPEPLASFDRWGDSAFNAIAGNDFEVIFDEPRNPIWQGNPDHAG